MTLRATTFSILSPSITKLSMAIQKHDTQHNDAPHSLIWVQFFVYDTLWSIMLSVVILIVLIRSIMLIILMLTVTIKIISFCWESLCWVSQWSPLCWMFQVGPLCWVSFCWVSQWEAINRKQITTWQHVSRLKASSFDSW